MFVTQITNSGGTEFGDLRGGERGDIGGLNSLQLCRAHGTELGGTHDIELRRGERCDLFVAQGADGARAQRCNLRSREGSGLLGAQAGDETGAQLGDLR